MEHGFVFQFFMYFDFACLLQEFKSSEPVQWEVRKQGSRSTPEFRVPKQIIPGLARPTIAPTVKMSQASWHGDAMEHDFYEEELPLNDVAIPSSNIDGVLPNSEGDEDKDPTMSVDLEIKKLELKKLQLLSSQHRRRGGRHAHGAYFGGSAQHGQGHGSDRLEQDTVMQTEDSEQRSWRQKVELQQQLEISEREHRGKKRYTMEVDMKGHPCGQNRPLWMTWLRGHAQDVDFSVDNYHRHNTTMLFSIKQCVNNTFNTIFIIMGKFHDFGNI